MRREVAHAGEGRILAGPREGDVIGMQGGRSFAFGRREMQRGPKAGNRIQDLAAVGPVDWRQGSFSEDLKILIASSSGRSRILSENHPSEELPRISHYRRIAILDNFPEASRRQLI
jgi:hypothetical protein